MDEACRLRRGEGLREAPRAQALRRAIGLAERMQSEASLGVCEDEPPETRLRCQRKRGSFGEYGKTARPAAPDGRFEFDFTADSLRPAPSARPCGTG